MCICISFRSGEWFNLKLNKLDEVWKPMYFLTNAAHVKNLESFGDESTVSFSYFHPNTLMFSGVQFVTIFCNMDFDEFPFDKHVCMLKMRSWLDIAENVILNDTFLIVENLQTSNKLDFDAKMRSLKSTTQKPFHKYDLEYSLARFQIDISRNVHSLSKLASGFYIPTGLFAFLSMISFTISLEQVPGRMGLLVTLYLILINTYNNIDAPSKRGFSWADVWIVGCQLPIAFAIIEYGVLLAALKVSKGKPKYADLLDFLSFFLSFISFCTFVAVYWS